MMRYLFAIYVKSVGVIVAKISAEGQYQVLQTVNWSFSVEVESKICEKGNRLTCKI